MGDEKTIVTINARQLHDAIFMVMEEVMEKRKQEENTALVSSKEVQSRLGVNRTTLNRWDKTGYLKLVKKGGRNWYHLKDIEEIEKGGGYNG